MLKNTEKSLGDLGRFSITQNQVRNRRLTLVWKTRKGVTKTTTTTTIIIIIIWNWIVKNSINTNKNQIQKQRKLLFSGTLQSKFMEKITGNKTDIAVKDY